MTFTTTVQDTTSNDTTGRHLINDYKCPSIVPLYYNITIIMSVCLSKTQAYPNILVHVDYLDNNPPPPPPTLKCMLCYSMVSQHDHNCLIRQYNVLYLPIWLVGMP